MNRKWKNSMDKKNKGVSEKCVFYGLNVGKQVFD